MGILSVVLDQQDLLSTHRSGRWKWRSLPWWPITSWAGRIRSSWAPTCGWTCFMANGSQPKAWFDCSPCFFLIFYLVVLLYGAVSSTAYSLGYWKDRAVLRSLAALHGGRKKWAGWSVFHAHGGPTCGPSSRHDLRVLPDAAAMHCEFLKDVAASERVSDLMSMN